MAKLEKLSNEGNFKHNVDVLQKKNGFLVVGRRQVRGNEFQVGDYLPCIYCKKFIQKKTLWLHSRNCSVKSLTTNQDEDSSNAVRLSRRLLSSAVMDEFESGTAKLLSRMQPDKITEQVKNDELIMRYAALKVESLGREQDQKIGDIYRVSQACRTIARVVIRCREKDPSIKDLDAVITPAKFDLVVSSTKSLCTDEKNAPSLGKLVGNNLAHVIEVKKGVALRFRNEQRLVEAETFHKLFKSEWNFRVNSVYLKMSNTLRRQKPKTIPLTEDLQKINNHISTEMEKTLSSLRDSSSSQMWTKLAKLTLCRLILFNKRRRAEVKDLKVQDYQSRPNWQKEQRGEFEMSLSVSDKMLAKR